MCAPDYFTANHPVNSFMNSRSPANTALAVRQWENLRDNYRLLGHTVSLLDPIPGLADMVFAANGGFSLGGRAYVASVTYPGRRPKAQAFQNWFESHGFDTHVPDWVNDGEGDFAVVGGVILAGTGFRSSRESHTELASIFGREVLSLTLVDPRFYHLDVALAVLDSEAVSGPGRIAYLPAAFDRASQAVLARRFPTAIVVDEEEAAQLALNSVSSRHRLGKRSAVYPPAAVPRLHAGPRGPVRTAQRRRRHQVLHSGTPPLSRQPPAEQAADSCSTRTRAADFVQNAAENIRLRV